MSELRWNPLLGTWVMSSPNRQNRPHLPKDWCPFCPSSGLVPEGFTVFAYPNDFPVLSSVNTQVEPVQSDLYLNAPAYGHCEVLLYSPDHNATLHSLPQDHVEELLRLWMKRYVALSADKGNKFIYIFENRGEEVGVTIHHPHGQLYAYSWIPSKIKTELDQCKAYFQQNGRNLLDDILNEELRYEKRVILQNDSFAAYIPYFTDYPYGVFISTKRARTSLTTFDAQDISDLASMLRKLTAAFDALFDRPFPFMMCLHQLPVNSPEYADADSYYRFHIEFYPPLRAKDKIKWYAGSEMGAGAAANPLDSDVCAEELRLALHKAVIGS